MRRKRYLYIYNVQQNLSGYHVKKTTEVLSFLSSCSLETVLKKMSSRQGCLKHFCPLLFLAKRACSLNIPHWISHYYDAQPVRTSLECSRLLKKSCVYDGAVYFASPPRDNFIATRFVCIGLWPVARHTLK